MSWSYGKPIYITCLILLLSACKNDRHLQDPSQSSLVRQDTGSKALTIPEIEIRSFRNEDQSWGYDILIDGKRYIHQPHIPAVGGNKGFTSETEARRVAEMVVGKISRGILPPAMTTAEVDSLLKL